jgi:hypothetical protein
MDSAPLTQQQLFELVKDVNYTEISPGVFQIPFDDGSFAHLTESTFVLGNADYYPDLNGSQCTYLYFPPPWSAKFTGMQVNRMADDFYASVKAVISANVNASDGDSSFEESDS